MAKDSEFKEFVIPEALPFGYPFSMFVEYVVDRVPQFQSVSGTRKGAKLIDAVVAAAEDKDGHLCRWPTDLWQMVVDTLKKDDFQMPKNFFIRNGTATHQMVPLRLYLPHADAILEASDPKPKSEIVDQPVAEKAEADVAAESAA